MLIKIHVIGNKDDLSPTIEKFNFDDIRWITGKLRESPVRNGKRAPMVMKLSEVVRLLQAFDNVADVDFEVT